MSTWKVDYLPEVSDDLKNLDGSVRLIVRKLIKRVSQNPLTNTEGGCGKPLGNVGEADLTGCCRIKLKKDGVRVVYKLIRLADQMLIVVVGARTDSEVCREAAERLKRHTEYISLLDDTKTDSLHEGVKL